MSSSSLHSQHLQGNSRGFTTTKAQTCFSQDHDRSTHVMCKWAYKCSIVFSIATLALVPPRRVLLAAQLACSLRVQRRITAAVLVG